MDEQINTGKASFNFSGKTVIVTGAARGIGRAMVKSFVDSGALVVAADRDAEGLAEICAALGDRVKALVADISTVEGAKSIVDEAVNRFGGRRLREQRRSCSPRLAAGGAGRGLGQGLRG